LSQTSMISHKLMKKKRKMRETGKIKARNKLKNTTKIMYKQKRSSH
jgi:hypothetical protein